jgi:hypothetical protein
MPQKSQDSEDVWTKKQDIRISDMTKGNADKAEESGLIDRNISARTSRLGMED